MKMTLYADECPADICQPGDYLCVAIVSFNKSSSNLKNPPCVAVGYVRKSPDLVKYAKNKIGKYNGINFLWTSLLGNTLNLFTAYYRPSIVDLYYDPKTLKNDLSEDFCVDTKKIIEQLSKEFFGKPIIISSIREGNKEMFGIGVADKMARGCYKKLEKKGHLKETKCMRVKDLTCICKNMLVSAGIQ